MSSCTLFFSRENIDARQVMLRLGILSRLFLQLFRRAGRGHGVEKGLHVDLNHQASGCRRFVPGCFPIMQRRENMSRCRLFQTPNLHRGSFLRQACKSERQGGKAGLDGTKRDMRGG